jgi:ArsR family transcriptional regulator, arsenate/arsenite/antimonite-responsive transcriptional repressor
MYHLIKAYKSLSEETRLRIINLLIQKECCVCEVEQALSISQPAASRNLRMLYDAGFIKLRKDGLMSIYYIDKKVTDKYLVDLIEHAIESMRDDNQIQKDIERLKKAQRIKSILLKDQKSS